MVHTQMAATAMQTLNARATSAICQPTSASLVAQTYSLTAPTTMGALAPSTLNAKIISAIKDPIYAPHLVLQY